MKKIGEFLNSQRKKLGLTAVAVGKKSGVSDAYILMIEKGKREPTFKILSKILTALDIPWKTFLDETGYLEGEQKPVKEKNLSDSEQDENKHFLRLYVAGQAPCSYRAIEGLKRIVFKEGTNLKFDLQILDVIKCPEVAEKENIIATPTLVVMHPTKKSLIIGDMSNIEKVLEALN